MSQERYVVLKHRDGWTVSLGADVVNLHGTEDEAGQAARREVRHARAAGGEVDFVGVLNARSHLEEDR